jgi:glutathione peroxidase
VRQPNALARHFRPRFTALPVAIAAPLCHQGGMTIYDFTARTIDGREQSLRDYTGKVLLLVNVASQCGLTPHYGGLQELYENFRGRGLVVLGFPCNQFGAQEPGSEAEIKQFCETRFGVTFPMFAKIEVNGAHRHALYAYLTSQPTQPDGPGDIQWNFAKFLVDRSGQVAARFAPQTAPVSEDIVGAIEKIL